MALRTPSDTSKQPTKKVDLFHPDMPEIPGLGGVPARQPQIQSDNKGPVKAIAMTAAGLLLALGVALVWWSNGRSQQPSKSASADIEIAPSAAPVPDLPPSIPAPVVASFDGRTRVGTTDELSAAWAAKKFVYVKPFTREQVNAIVVRLPGGGLWAFALQEPNGRCELEYTTDLHALATQYRYRAAHPMVVNPCNGTVYDPLKVGSLGGSILVRGDIVKGDGSRPPIAIDVERSGKFIIADRIE